MNHLTKLGILTIIGSAIGAGFYFHYSGNTVTEPALAQTEKITPVISKEIREKIYSTADFNGHGRTNKSDRTSEILHVEINPQLSPVTFLITSFTSTTHGAIYIYRDSKPDPVQTILLPDPDMFLGDRIHEFFNVADLNFDGYLDIGVLEEGGTKWGAYQYWLFDEKTNTFVENTFTQDFRKLNFNQIIFDQATKQITINNFCGTLICDKDIYQVTNTHLNLFESYHQEQPYSSDNDGTPLKTCVNTVEKHQENKITKTENTSENYCDGYYW